MKITGYTQQITNVSGSSSSAATLSSSAVAKAAASQAIDMTPVAKGLGSWANTIDKIHDQEDNENVMKAMDAYNKARFATMYNEDNGLMNTQADGANGIADGYVEQEKKYRAEILGATKLHSRAKQAALDDLMNRSAEQGYQLVAKHQFQQKEKARDIDYNNNIQNFVEFAQKNWNNPDMLNIMLQNASLMTAARYSGVDNSEALIEQAKRKSFGYIVGSAIDSAMQNEDYATAQKYNDEYGHWLTPAQRASAGKVIYAKGKSKWENSLVKQGMAVCGKDPNKFKEWIKNQPGYGMTQGTSNLASEMADLMGKIGYYGEGKNTYCAKAVGMLPSLKGTEYEGETWVPSFMEKAKARGEWHQGVAGMRPGDIVVVNGDNHIVVMDDNGGTIQNGASGNNGKGGIYRDPRSPEKMFGTENVTGYIRVGSGNATPRPMEQEEQDKLVKQFMTEVNTEKRIKNMADDQSNDAFFSEVYQWSTEGKMTMEQALAEARKRSGGDKDLMKDYISTVHLCYNKANGGPGGTGSGNGAGKAAPSYLIDQAKTLLRNGTFKSQQEYVDYVGNALGGNLNQVWKAREDYNDFKKSAGEFKFDLGGMVNGAMTDKFTGQDKLSGTDKAVVAAGVRMYVGKKIAEFRLKNKRDPEMTEVGPMIEEALTSNTFTYQTPGRIFSGWTNDNDFNLTAAELQTMGIDAIQKVNGYSDLYNVRMSDGNIVQMNAARLYAIRNNQVNRG